jgi:hypothetical protein
LALSHGRPPVPNRPQEASSLPIPLLGSLQLLLVGGWVGAGPAIIAGMLGGLMRALFINGQASQIFEFAFLGLGRLLPGGALAVAARRPCASAPLRARL